MLKKIIPVVISALALSGCFSYSVMIPWKGDVTTESGEKPIATFGTEIVSYQLLGMIPLGSGIPLTAKTGKFDNTGAASLGMDAFADHATVDNTLETLKYALKECKTDRVDHLRWSVTSDSGWSCCLIDRKVAFLSCTILPPEK